MINRNTSHIPDAPPASRSFVFACSLAGVFLLAGCADSPTEKRSKAESPLIGGTITTDDPAVVALVFSGPNSFCTGTVISPRVILTAAHCIDMLGNDPNASIYFGSDTRGDGRRVTVRAKKQHPLWTGDLSGGHDVGMLLMDFPVPDPTIAKELNTADIADHIGADYRHVGFGVFDRETGNADGKKRTGVSSITRTQGDVIISGDDQVSVCFGDSGGPAFLTIDGNEVVAGIHSFTTGSDCFAPNGDTNVQMYATDFILPWVQQNDPSCELDGVCGAIGCDNDPDCEPCGPDGTCTQDCALPDPDCQTQQLGEICRAASQCVTEFCAAFRIDPDYRFCTQSCDLNNDTCPQDMPCTNVPPFGDVCYYEAPPQGVLGDTCEAPEECGSYQCADGLCVVKCDLSVGLRCPDTFSCETRDDGGNYYCYAPPAEEGGCQIGSDNPKGNFLALFLVTLGLWTRRKRCS